MRKQIIVLLEIERSKMNREQSTLVMDKGLNIYFFFLLFAILGIITRTLSIAGFFVLIIMGFVILLVTSYPYIKDMIAEKQRVNRLIDEFEGKKKNAASMRKV